MKLYSGPLSMFGAKAEIALREKKLPFELEMAAFSQAQGYQPRHPEVLRVNPKRQVARHTVPMTDGLNRLRSWRRRMASRPAVTPVIDAMANYLKSIDYPVPDYGRED